MENIKVSVVIPVYNTEEYVAETLNSIMNQSLDELEIIVINDGSTDNSLDVIKSIATKDNRIKVYSQPNKGLSETRNSGIKKARGEFIYFMDSDDLLDSRTLSDCFEKCKTDNLDFVFFDAEPFGMKNIEININYRRTHKLKDGVYSGIEALNILLNKKGYLASACLNFINLAYLKRIQLYFYPDLLHEDELFTFILFLKASRVGFLPSSYFKRRFREGSITTRKFSRANLQGYFGVARQLIIFKKGTHNIQAQNLINYRLREMFYGILYNTRSMKFADRNYVLMTCIQTFIKYIRIRDLFLAYFPLSRLLK